MSQAFVIADETLAPTSSIADRRLLVVEDESLVALGIAKMLKDEGADLVGIASSSSNALGFIEQTAVDAAVLDIGLGEGDVYMFAEALIERGIPFVFYSSRYVQGPSVRFYAGVPVVDKTAPNAMERLKSALHDLLAFHSRSMTSEAPRSMSLH